MKRIDCPIRRPKMVQIYANVFKTIVSRNNILNSIIISARYVHAFKAGCLVFFFLFPLLKTWSISPLTKTNKCNSSTNALISPFSASSSRDALSVLAVVKLGTHLIYSLFGRAAFRFNMRLDAVLVQ